MTAIAFQTPQAPAGAIPCEDDVRRHVADCLRRIDAYADPAVWIHRLPADAVYAQLDAAVKRLRAGVTQPLFGLTVAVKDNLDFAGVPTTAACPDFAYTPEASATVIRRLCDAGAIVVGKTNLDQFATGLVGTRSPYGACRNVYNPAYISGGSSSGSAVAVAAGLTDVALGTDTAGSGRVPAAFNNLVGLKPTRGLLSTTGAVPACRSLDCVSVFARTCEMTGRVFEQLRGFDPADPYSRRPEDVPPPDAAGAETGMRFGIPADSELEFFGNRDSERLYRRAVARVQSLGGSVVTIDFRPFLEAARLLYEGPWVAERLAAVKELFARSPGSLLPVTRAIIGSASRFSAVDVFEAMYRLQALRRRAEAEWERMDLLLLPTTGTIYTLAEIEADPLGPNRNLGYYTNFVNLLDLSALALPNGFQLNGLPVGVTLMARAGGDDLLLHIGSRFEAATRAEAGGDSSPIKDPS